MMPRNGCPDMPLPCATRQSHPDLLCSAATHCLLDSWYLLQTCPELWPPGPCTCGHVGFLMGLCLHRHPCSGMQTGSQDRHIRPPHSRRICVQLMVAEAGETVISFYPTVFYSYLYIMRTVEI